MFPDLGETELPQIDSNASEAQQELHWCFQCSFLFIYFLWMLEGEV